MEVPPSLSSTPPWWSFAPKTLCRAARFSAARSSAATFAASSSSISPRSSEKASAASFCWRSLRMWQLTVPDSTTYAESASSPCRQIASPGLIRSIRISLRHASSSSCASSERRKGSSMTLFSPRAAATARTLASSRCSGGSSSTASSGTGSAVACGGSAMISMASVVECRPVNDLRKAEPHSLPTFLSGLARSPGVDVGADGRCREKYARRCPEHEAPRRSSAAARRPLLARAARCGRARALCWPHAASAAACPPPSPPPPCRR